MTDIDVEKLRISLILSSIEFLATIRDKSYLAFAKVETTRIRMVLDATPDMLKDLQIIRGY